MNTKPLQLLCTLVCLVGAISCSAQAQDQPLKVFVLVGQSNMQGHAQVRTLPHVGMDPSTKPLLDQIQNETGEPRVHENVWVSYLSSGGVKTGQLTTGYGADENKVGPELTFGIEMQKKVGQPILIIKTAWGGKSINTDFRSPSAGPYVFEESAIERMKKQGKDVEALKAAKEKATGVYYRLTVNHVKEVLADIKSVYPGYDAKQGYELAGMVWFQGWNDMVDSGTYPNRGDAGGYDRYSEVLGHMIRDFRKDLAAPKLPFVIGVLGVNGPTDQYTQQQRYKKVHQGFRDAMAAPASEDEFKGNVFVVLTENCWDMELDGLVARDAAIKSKLKKLQSDGKAETKNWKANLEKSQAEEFTPEERKILETGVSNAAYHYLGSSKIMARIGKAFADALSVQ